MYVVTTFYKIFDLPEVELLNSQKEFKDFMIQNNLKGTILLGAHEGLNSTIAGERENIDKFYKYMENHRLFSGMTYKESFCDFNPFDKIKVRIKKEIVAIRCDVDFNGEKGVYIAPEDWDEFISRSDVVVIDTRNDYEYEIGAFEGSINPNIEAFRDLPKWLQENKKLFDGKKIATFCTGGMRCEKLTAYMIQNGFPRDQVYHLDGGILAYFEKTGNKNKKWIGDCFVFDNRGAIDENLAVSKNYAYKEIRRAKNKERENEKEDNEEDDE